MSTEPLTHDEEAALRSIVAADGGERTRPQQRANYGDVRRLLATLDAARLSVPSEALAEALRDRLPVKDTATHSDTGIPVTLAVHYGTRETLIEAIAAILAALAATPPGEPGAAAGGGPGR